MIKSKYSKFLTVLLVIVIIAVVGLLGFLGYDIYKKYYTDKEAGAVVQQFENQLLGSTEDNGGQVDTSGATDGLDSTPGGDGSSSSSKVITYKGFVVKGTIEIPKTGIKYPVLESVTKKSLESSVAILYPDKAELNQVGNTVIVGHNYRNGLFFSKNNNIENGDKIYITDLTGKKVTYVVYNKYVTTPEDADYMVRDTGGAREISLSTCTNDSKGRIIIWAKEE